ncbi:NAD kinase [Robertkochia marina]|uniref:NAD kinase n=1 Tax=Robertkochia marina TaxID=1227945 RepID=A0A4S3M2P3_9FLAO|nr:NAD kinase [Robertkochia marina]THD68949.1 NAD kinase [Robertkochia marina]TRZ44768.1 NAD kinase [Robertkochia marina]
MKIGIYGQYYQEDAAAYVSDLLDLLHEHPTEVFIESKYYKDLESHGVLKRSYPVFSSFFDLDESYELLISVGGDGTMLRSVLLVRDLDIPIMGVNTGRLGFLATVQKGAMKQAVLAVLKGDYEVRRRSLLQVTTNPGVEAQTEVNFALNEVAVSRKNTTSMITVNTWLDDEYLTAYWADGLIIATPTGSTGYSLSCNGPVITPATNAFVLTPIAPHNLNARPLVIPDKTKIRLKVSGREEYFLVSLDSRIATLHNETEIFIEKAPFTIGMVYLKEESFLNTLRQKLLWGEDKRN